MAGDGAEAEPRAEFAAQVETLIRKGYPGRAGLSEDAFADRIAPLEGRLDDLGVVGADGEGRVRFVVVVPAELVPPDEAIQLVELEGRHGFTRMDDLARFTPIEGVELPSGPAYLVGDVDTGRATLNVTPDAALPTIVGEGRSPLTIDEGVALLTHHPEVLRTHNAFSMLGSRCGDRRVTAMWVSAGSPRLGWCWAGNPHTWLGSASCARRLGA